jgi:hypothetical protein
MTKDNDSWRLILSRIAQQQWIEALTYLGAGA